MNPNWVNIDLIRLGSIAFKNGSLRLLQKLDSFGGIQWSDPDERARWYFYTLGRVSRYSAPSFFSSSPSDSSSSSSFPHQQRHSTSRVGVLLHARVGLA